MVGAEGAVGGKVADEFWVEIGWSERAAGDEIVDTKTFFQRNEWWRETSVGEFVGASGDGFAVVTKAVEFVATLAVGAHVLG